MTSYSSTSSKYRIQLFVNCMYLCIKSEHIPHFFCKLYLAPEKYRFAFSCVVFILCILDFLLYFPTQSSFLFFFTPFALLLESPHYRLHACNDNEGFLFNYVLLYHRHLLRYTSWNTLCEVQVCTRNFWKIIILHCIVLYCVTICTFLLWWMLTISDALTFLILLTLVVYFCFQLHIATLTQANVSSRNKSNPHVFAFRLLWYAFHSNLPSCAAFELFVYH